MRQLRPLATIGLGWLLMGQAVAAAAAAAAAADLPNLVELRASIRESGVGVEERARRALEGASSFDQAAQESNNLADRRARWASAITLIDEFLGENPEVESTNLVRFQAGVYRWAEGRGLSEQSEQTPRDPKIRLAAIQALDDAVRRFREIKPRSIDNLDIFAQNLRFRTAQAIADRANLDPDGDEGRNRLEREALGMLDNSLVAPGLRPFALLLRCELFNRLRLFGQAQMEIEQVEKLSGSLPPGALLAAKIVAMSGRGQYDEARKVVEVAKVPDLFKALLSLRITLARRREKPPGADRQTIDDEAFRQAEAFRGSNRPESKKGLMELARTIDEPGPKAEADCWDLLAEGHLRLGDPVRAGRLEAKGGDRAQALGQLEKAGSLRYKASAYLFEAGKFPEVERLLTKVLEGPGVAPDLKARAGMLRALARGRSLANHDPESSRPGYLAALESQIRDFPKDPSTGEARWLLGQIRMMAGRPDEPVELWSLIAHSHPRWLEARVMIADQLREAVESQRINRDSSAVASKMELARKSLRSALGEALEGLEDFSLTLQVARLELIPEAGRPTLALEACDRLLKTAARPDQHQVARLYKMVALAQAGRASEAEQIARIESKTDNPAVLLPALRLLDRSSRDAETEANRRRIGLIARILTTRLVENLDEFSGKFREEARLHHARALLFSGNAAAARKEIADWGGPIEIHDDEFLAELADTYQRLDAYVMAVDAERYRSSRLAPGSPSWFESRYGMALAYFRDNRPKDAAQIIDATAILHPDLGGGELRVKFDRLRQKIGKN